MSRRRERSHLELAASHRTKLIVGQVLVGVLGGLWVGTCGLAVREFVAGRVIPGIGFVLVGIVLVAIALVGVYDAQTRRGHLRTEERLAGLLPYQGSRYRAVWMWVGSYRRLAVLDATTDELTPLDAGYPVERVGKVLAMVAHSRDRFVWVPAAWYVVTYLDEEVAA